MLPLSCHLFQEYISVITAVMLLTVDITIGSQEQTEMHTVPSNATYVFMLNTYNRFSWKIRICHFRNSNGYCMRESWGSGMGFPPLWPLEFTFSLSPAHPCSPQHQQYFKCKRTSFQGHHGLRPWCYQQQIMCFVFLCVNIFEIMTALMDPEITPLCLIMSMKVL